MQLISAKESLKKAQQERDDTDAQMRKLLKLHERVGGAGSTEEEVLGVVESLINPSSDKARSMNTFSRFTVELSSKLERLRGSKAPMTEAFVQTDEVAISEGGDLENCDPNFIARWLRTSNSSQRKQVQEEVLK